MPYLILMQGLPSSGKTTRAAEYAKHYKALIVCPKTIQAELSSDGPDQASRDLALFIAHDRVHQALRTGTSVVLDDDNTCPRQVRHWHMVAQRHHATLQIVRLVGQLSCVWPF